MVKRQAILLIESSVVGRACSVPLQKWAPGDDRHPARLSSHRPQLVSGRAPP
jgi:hypothetical protein